MKQHQHYRCHELSVCQGLGPKDCPECDAWECEVACTEPPHPTIRFAPGVIQGPGVPNELAAKDDVPLLSPAEMAAMAVLVVLLAFLVYKLTGWLV